MGRPANIEREQARAAGLRFYTAADACDRCFDDRRYVSNGQCVTCSINAGKLRYRALDPGQHEVRRAREHARYMARAQAIPFDDSDFV